MDEKQLIEEGIYNVFGVKKLPLLGLGGRPKGAYSCSDFYNCNDFII